MSTKVTRVFSSFLQKISDYSFALDTEQGIKYAEESMFSYFKTARANFLACPKDLSTDFDDEDEDIDFTQVTIKDKLSDLEVEILALLMLTEYFHQLLIRDETVKQALSDSDFSISSQANHISQLQGLYDKMNKEANVSMAKYTFAEKVYGKKQ